MKKILLGTVGLIAAGLSGAASAADLPARTYTKAPAMAVAAYSWTGFYIGGQVGYDWGRENSGIFTPALIQGYGVNQSGVIGGGHVGYNYQFGNGSGVVIGLEGDLDGLNYSNSYLVSAPFGGSATIKNDYQSSIRGRLGYAVDRTLFYATGGVAFGHFNTSYSFGPGTDSFSNDRTGWTGGAGVEYAVDRNWSLRAEYRYTDFGYLDNALTAATLSAGDTIRHHEFEQRAQVGFSYKFDTLGPVVAKY